MTLEALNKLLGKQKPVIPSAEQLIEQVKKEQKPIFK